MFPDTTIVETIEKIDIISSNSFIKEVIYVNLSNFISILAVFDVYLVLDLELTLFYEIGGFQIPIHLINRIQDYWKAPYPLNNQTIDNFI